MLRFRIPSRTRIAPAARIAALLLCGLAIGAPSALAASAEASAEASRVALHGANGPRSGSPGPARARPDAARPGAFCLPGGCPPPAASLWNGAAFGAALIAIGWQARRRPSTSA